MGFRLADPHAGSRGDRVSLRRSLGGLVAYGLVVAALLCLPALGRAAEWDGLDGTPQACPTGPDLPYDPPANDDQENGQLIARAAIDAAAICDVAKSLGGLEDQRLQKLGVQLGTLHDDLAQLHDDLTAQPLPVLVTNDDQSKVPVAASFDGPVQTDTAPVVDAINEAGATGHADVWSLLGVLAAAAFLGVLWKVLRP